MARKKKEIPETEEQFLKTHTKCAGCGEWVNVQEMWVNPEDNGQYHYLCLPNEYREKLKNDLYKGDNK